VGFYNFHCLQAKLPQYAMPNDWHMPLAYTVRDRMLELYIKTVNAIETRRIRQRIFARCRFTLSPKLFRRRGDPMPIHPLAGKPAPPELLVDLDKLRKQYYARKPNITATAERVRFGTSGHRGSSLRGSFNEAHVLAIAQAICEYRNGQGISGPLYIGKDTHGLSEPAFASA